MLNEVHAEVAVSWVVTHELVLSMPSFGTQRAVHLGGSRGFGMKTHSNISEVSDIVFLKISSLENYVFTFL